MFVNGENRQYNSSGHIECPFIKLLFLTVYGMLVNGEKGQYN